MHEIFMFTLFVVLIAVVLPVWIIAHYATRWRTSKVITNADEQLMSDLWESARKMEDRIRNLERILDEESPHWRERL